MKAKDIDVNSISWEDIVFENRNKAYGAYFLRNSYVRNVALAVVGALAIVGFVLIFPAISAFFKERAPRRAAPTLITSSGNPGRAAPQLPEFLLEECVPND